MVMGAKISVIRGDIRDRDVDVIVNAANTTLLGGGGVDGAIHRAAGPELLAECRALGGCETGDAKLTKGYRLPARWVIHTVGPIWKGGKAGEDALLATAYRRSLEVAAAAGARTIAFPSISTGAYNFPVDRAARIAITTIRDFIQRNDAFDEILIVCFDDRTLRAYNEEVAAETHLGTRAD